MRIIDIVVYATGIVVPLLLSFGIWHGLGDLVAKGNTKKGRFHGLLIALLCFVVLGGIVYQAKPLVLAACTAGGL